MAGPLLAALLGAGCGAAISEKATPEDTTPPGTAIVSWDANRESDLRGYRVYVGRRSNDYDWSTDVGLTTTHTLRDLPSGTHYFAVTAYDTDGNESAFSPEVSKNVR